MSAPSPNGSNTNLRSNRNWRRNRTSGPPSFRKEMKELCKALNRYFREHPGQVPILWTPPAR